MRKILFIVGFCCLMSCTPTASNTDTEQQESHSELMVEPSSKKNTNNPSVSKLQVNHYEVSTPYASYLVGKTNFASDTGFTLVDDQYASKEIYLRKEVYEAFVQMAKAALKEGINLQIISGARSFDHQKAIWEKKWNNLPEGTPEEKALQILQFSSMPMSSRHHWGTDIDLNNLNNSYFETGEGLKIYAWLTKHASDYGFYQVYTDKVTNHRTGYEMEKWHWSYMPLAQQVLERYNKQITIKDITGFKGAESASGIDIIANYVNGITDNYKKND